jgi:hypothetical protein
MYRAQGDKSQPPALAQLEQTTLDDRVDGRIHCGSVSHELMDDERDRQGVRGIGSDRGESRRSVNQRTSSAVTDAGWQVASIDGRIHVYSS